MLTDAQLESIARTDSACEAYWKDQVEFLLDEVYRLKAHEAQARKLYNALLTTDSVLDAWREGKANKGDRGRCKYLNKKAMVEARKVLSPEDDNGETP